MHIDFVMCKKHQKPFLKNVNFFEKSHTVPKKKPKGGSLSSQNYFFKLIFLKSEQGTFWPDKIFSHIAEKHKLGNPSVLHSLGNTAKLWNTQSEYPLASLGTFKNLKFRGLTKKIVL